jgi:hypothetical protein
VALSAGCSIHPEPARTELIERTKAGEQLSHQDVKQIVHQHRPAPATPPRPPEPAPAPTPEPIPAHQQPCAPTQADWQRRIQTEVSVYKQVTGDEGRPPLPAPATAPPEPNPVPAPPPKPAAPAQGWLDLHPLGATPQPSAPAPQTPPEQGAAPSTGPADPAPSPDPLAADLPTYFGPNKKKKLSLDEWLGNLIFLIGGQIEALFLT